MTARIEKTVFISYRRTNLPWALAIYQELTHHGYDVFFDYLSIPSGDFENILVENIKARSHFVVILTPSALERCNEPGDWLRREIETAMNEKRNIIPLMLESFDFGSPSTTKALIGKLEKLKKYNGLRLHSEYFFEGMDRLRKQYLNVSLDTVIHPVSEETKPVIEEHQIAANDAQPVEKEELTAQEWFERGGVFAKERNLDEAIRCYTESINHSPEFVEAYFSRGFMYSNKDNIDNAIQDYDKAINVKPVTPENVIFYEFRARALIVRGDFDSAIADLTNAIRLNTNDSVYYYLRGLTYMNKGDFDNALKDYNEAIRLKPDYTDAYFNRANARTGVANINGALADYNEVLRLEPNYANAYYNRGAIFEKKRIYASAVVDYQKYLDLGGGERDGDQKEIENIIKNLKNKLTKKKSVKKKKPN